MSLFSQAADNAAASGAKVAASVAGTAYSFSSLPYSSMASIATLVLTLLYVWNSLPRWWRTSLAIKRGLINKDWSLWNRLGDQPTPTKED